MSRCQYTGPIVDAQGLWQTICVQYPYSIAPGSSGTLGSYATTHTNTLVTFFEDSLSVWPRVYANTVCTTTDNQALDCSYPSSYLWFQVDSWSTMVVECTPKDDGGGDDTTTGGGGSSNMGAIIGGVVGGVVALAAVAVLAFVCMRKRKRGRETDYRLDVIEPGERFSGAVAPTAPKSALTASMVAPGPLLPATPVVRLPNACGAVPFATAPSGGTDGAPAACAASLPPGPGLGAPLAAGPLASGPLARGLITSLGSAPVTPAGSAPATPLTFSAPAAAASQTATDTSRASLDIDSKALSQDPLLTYLKTRNEAAAAAPLKDSAGSAGSGGEAARMHSGAPSGGVDAGSWEVPFKDVALRRPIGEGSFGRVYLAEWHSTTVAVKVLFNKEAAAQLSSDTVASALALPAHMQAKLEAEAGLLAALRHPCIVSFYAMCREPPCLITEYCSRGSLNDVLAAARRDPALAARLTWRQLVSMALDASRGMLYLHTRTPSILHRDLKSPNLLVDEHFRVKVSDFNLSRILQDESKSTSLAAMNPRWLAPEILRAGRSTKASDVFAFGTIMWELLTWELPWLDQSGWQLVNQLMMGARLPVPAREQLLCAEGPDEAAYAAWCSLMQAAWSEVEAARPSFEEITEELKSLLGE